MENGGAYEALQDSQSSRGRHIETFRCCPREEEDNQKEEGQEMKWFGLILHIVSLSFAVLLVPITLIGAFRAAYVQKPLEAVWGILAFFLSCYLSKKLSLHCLDKLERIW